MRANPFPEPGPSPPPGLPDTTVQSPAALRTPVRHAREGPGPQWPGPRPAAGPQTPAVPALIQGSQGHGSAASERKQSWPGPAGWAKPEARARGCHTSQALGRLAEGERGCCLGKPGLPSPGWSEQVGAGAGPDCPWGSMFGGTSWHVLGQLMLNTHLPWERARENEDSAGGAHGGPSRESRRRGAAVRPRQGPTPRQSGRTTGSSSRGRRRRGRTSATRLRDGAQTRRPTRQLLPCP